MNKPISFGGNEGSGLFGGFKSSGGGGFGAGSSSSQLANKTAKQSKHSKSARRF